jgi:spermidine synthase
MMVHLPLTSLSSPPKKGLVLCLGMGTSFRSMVSWGIDSTVVELVPSIQKMLPYFHADGDMLLKAPNGRIVTDDARRFLERSKETFDVIIVDPPPPIEAAASSLLYSREFYTTVSKRLAPNGIFQQWIPGWRGGDLEPITISSIAKALEEQFPYVRVFVSFGDFGLHILASKQPIPLKSPEEMARLLPEKAAKDIVEWGPNPTPQEQFASVLSKEVSIQDIVKIAPDAPVISDDRPVNEYYLLRRLFSR